MPLYCHPAGFDSECPLCRRAQADPAFHRFAATVPPPAWESGVPARTAFRPLPLCGHLGERLPGPCGAQLHRCDLDGAKVTRFGGCADATRTCQTCTLRPDRPPPLYPPAARRHLVMHVLPVAGNGVWRRSIDQLRLRWQLFDGARVFSVATGVSVKEQGTGRELRLDPPAAVRDYLPPGCDVVEVPNRPDRWELQSWPLLWSRVLPLCQPDDAVLYCHAKGVTRPAGSPAHRWADLLWRLSLDYWPEVADLLTRHLVCGPLKKTGAFGTKTGVGTGGARWHYSGNFWWARAGVQRERFKAVAVPLDPWGAEAWPGIAYRPDEAGPLMEVPNNHSLYDRERMDAVDGQFARWQESRAPTPAAILSVPPVRVFARPADRPTVSVVIPTCGRGSLDRAVASVTPQLLHGDEVIVVRDDSGDPGHTARNEALPRCRGDYLLFLDDDDVSLPGALDAVRRAAKAHPGKVLLFRMRRGAPCNDVIPVGGVTAPRLGQVSTQTVAAPNDPDRLGVWGCDRRAGDWDFVRTTLGVYPPDGWVQLPDVIAHWRPDPDPPVRDWHDVPGWFDYAALYDEAVERAADGGTLVEVGVWMGRSLFYLAGAARRSGKKLRVVGVDLWEPTAGNQAAAATRALATGGRPTLWERFQRNLRECGLEGAVGVLRLPSVEAAARFADGSLDFVFLDAAHDEPSVRADVAAWRPKVRPGGVLAGHDFVPRWPGVVRAVTEAFGPAAESVGSCWRVRG